MPKYEVVYTGAARADIIAIGDYIREAAGDVVASRFVERIVAASDTLSKQPLRQRVRIEVAPDVRAIRVGRYLIFYRVETTRVAIVRVLHDARKITADLLKP